MSQVTVVRQEDASTQQIATHQRVKPVIKRNQQQETLPQQMEVSTTKRVRIELDNVQNIVESIRTDFNHYQNINNNLRLQLLKKKKHLEGIGANTNDLSAHLGCLGAKVSVNQKKYQHQLVEFDYFEKSLDELTQFTITGFQSRLRDFFELVDDMSCDIQKMAVKQANIRLSLEDIEHSRDDFLSSFDNLTAQKSHWQEAHAACCLEIQTLHACSVVRDNEYDCKKKELCDLTHESSHLQKQLDIAEHQCDVDNRQVNDQRAAFLSLQSESRDALEELRTKTAALREKIHTLQQEEVSNKQGHLKRLQDDIQAKMDDTHALNRECDKATIDFAEKEHLMQEIAAQRDSSCQLAAEAIEAKRTAAAQVRASEQALESAKQQALESEQRLAERINSSKASISAFFALKKEVNEKEWQIGKAKTNLEQAVSKQSQQLAGLESRNLAAGVQLTAEKQEKEVKDVQLEKLSAIILTAEAKTVENEAILREIEDTAERLAQGREGLQREHKELLQAAMRQRAAEEERVQQQTDEKAELAALQMEASRITAIRENLDVQLVIESAENKRFLQDADDTTASGELTAEELADADRAAEQEFQSWLTRDEGQAQKQRHEDRVRELRKQTWELQAELEGGGKGPELFPQVAIARNNELARLKQSISATWESLKRENFTNLVSRMEQDIEHKAVQEAHSTAPSVSASAPVQPPSLHSAELSPASASTPLLSQEAQAEGVVGKKLDDDIHTRASRTTSIAIAAISSTASPDSMTTAFEGHPSKRNVGEEGREGQGVGEGRGKKRESLTYSAQLGEEQRDKRDMESFTAIRPMPPPKSEKLSDEAGSLSRTEGKLFFPSQGANLQPLFRPAPVVASSRLQPSKGKHRQTSKQKYSQNNVIESEVREKEKDRKAKVGADGSGSRSGRVGEAITAAAAPKQATTEKKRHKRLEVKAMTSHTSAARFKRKTSLGSGGGSCHDGLGGGNSTIWTRPAAAPPSQDDGDVDWFFSEGW